MRLGQFGNLAKISPNKESGILYITWLFRENHNGENLSKIAKVLYTCRNKSDMSMSENQSTLENLLVDEQKMNEEILHDLLNGYIKIGKQSGDLIPQDQFRDLTAKRKTLMVLLAQHARAELDMVESEWMSPGEISTQSGINQNTVYPTVRELDNGGLIEGDDGSYRIPSHSINQVRSYINGGDENE